MKAGKVARTVGACAFWLFVLGGGALFYAVPGEWPKTQAVWGSICTAWGGIAFVVVALFALAWVGIQGWRAARWLAERRRDSRFPK